MGGWGGRVTALQACEPPLTLQLTSPAILRGMLAISAQILWAKTVCVCVFVCIYVCEYACMCVREHVCFLGKNKLSLYVCVSHPTSHPPQSSLIITLS